MSKVSDIFTGVILVEGESEEELLRLKETVRKELKPKGVLAELFTDMVVADFWKIRRVSEYETKILGRKDDFVLNASYNDSSFLERFIKYKKSIQDSLSNWLNELEKLKKDDKFTPQSPEK